MFKGPAGFGRIVNIVMNVLLCAALNYYVLWYNQQLLGPDVPVLTLFGWFVSFVQSMFVGITFGDLVPGFAWGHKVAAALGVKNPTAAYVIACCVHALVLVSLISFICTWLASVQTAGMAGVIAGWNAIWPMAVLLGAIILILFMNPVMKMASKASGFDPTAA